MQVETRPGVDVPQAEMLAQRLFETMMDAPDALDSATAIAAVILLSRHVLTLAEKQAQYHELPHASNHIRQAFCNMVMHDEPRA